MIAHLSIRSRVLITMLTVFAVTLVALGAAVTVYHQRSVERSVDQRLQARAQLGEQMARHSHDIGTIESALAIEPIKVHLLLASGESVGPAAPEDGSRYRYHRTVLSSVVPELDGAQLTAWVSVDVVTDEVNNLRELMLVASLSALVLAALLVLLTIDPALQPLAVMADRAKRVSQGERGIRLGTPDDVTEVGRTATAIDDMLDELETAMTRAHNAEQRAEDSRARMQQFLADAAHELKTPLAGIQAAAEALVQMPHDSDPWEREGLSVLLAREARRSGQLVASLLEAARIDSGVELADEWVDLVDVIEAERTRVALARPEVTVIVDLEPVVVRGDPHALTSVVSNVVDNAARAASPQGWVSVHLARRVDEDGDWAVLHVADSGPGIAPADRERVFERLVRLSETASTAPGSGLGLPIARGYARAHGGELRYCEDEVVPGAPSGRHGAAFVITLPVTRNPGGATPT